LVRYLRRDPAFGGVAFDIFDHLDLGLAETPDQLAGDIRRRMALAGGLDQLAALLRLFAQGNELLHAVLRRTALRRRRTLERGAADRCRTTDRKRAGRRGAERSA